MLAIGGRWALQSGWPRRTWIGVNPRRQVCGSPRHGGHAARREQEDRPCPVSVHCHPAQAGESEIESFTPAPGWALGVILEAPQWLGCEFRLGDYYLRSHDATGAPRAPPATGLTHPAPDSLGRSQRVPHHLIFHVLGRFHPVEFRAPILPRPI
jgi:hypothetical protein